MLFGDFHCVGTIFQMERRTGSTLLPSRLSVILPSSSSIFAWIVPRHRLFVNEGVELAAHRHQVKEKREPKAEKQRVALYVSG